MTGHDPRVDAYISRSADFAQPILAHLRAAVHAACPEVEEDIKWGMPFFSYKGAPICNMAAFKQHCSFGFWLHRQVVGEDAQDGMGQFGKLALVKDLPAKKTLLAHIRKAMALNEPGVRHVRPKAAPKPPPTTPDDLAAALAQKRHAAAHKHWSDFTPGKQREYVAWLTGAKTAATRQKRLATTLE